SFNANQAPFSPQTSLQLSHAWFHRRFRCSLKRFRRFLTLGVEAHLNSRFQLVTLTSYRTVTSVQISSLPRAYRHPMAARQFLCSVSVCSAWLLFGASLVEPF